MPDRHRESRHSPSRRASDRDRSIRDRKRSESRSRSRSRDRGRERDTGARKGRGRSRSSHSRSRSISPRPTHKRKRSTLRSISRTRRDRRIHRSRSRHSRSRSRSRSRDRRQRRKRSRGRDQSVSSSDGSEDGYKRRKERKKEKERKRERKREKKAKKDKKHKSEAQWGKYGVISEADIFTKSAEFHTWLVEERKINPETISKEQSKKEFARYVEDYNTSTLPHEKYYNMEAYDRRMSALRQGEFVPPSDDAYDPQADMKALSGVHKRKAIEHESYLSTEQLQELRRVQKERIEAGKMRLLGMEVKQNMGVRMDGTMFDD